MQKFLPALVLLSFLAILVIPLIASAQEGPVECCKIRRTITLGSETCTKDLYAGPNNTTCVLSNAPPTCPTGGTAVGSQTWGMFYLMNTINTVVDWFFAVLVVIAVLLTILGAFTLLTSAGSPEKVKSGRDYVLYAAIGLAVALIARAIPALVKSIIGY